MSARSSARFTNRRYLRAAVVAAALLVVGTLAVFLQGLPFTGGYEIRGVFSSASQLREGSDVRLAGLRVGEVTGIEAGPDTATAVVTMRIEDEGRPIHADATLAVVPRLILEGNASVAVSPGTPRAPELESGATIPDDRTSTPVQLDEVLDVFDLPTRGSLHRSFAELGQGLGDGDEGGQAGHTGLRRAFRELDGALDNVTTVARAARGTEEGDLDRVVRHTGATTAQLASDPQAVADLVTNTSRFTAALAADERALAASVRGFDEVLAAAPPTLRELDAALPVLTRFADRLRPALRAAPVTLRETNLLLDQIRAMVRPAELPALLDQLDPVTQRLPRLVDRLRTLFGFTRPVTDCIATHVVPTLDKEIDDGRHSTGDPVWLDLMHGFTGFTSFASAVDGNGGTVRLGITGGPLNLTGAIPGLGEASGRMPEFEGVRPTWLGYGVDPPYRPDARCADQPLPDLTKRSGPPPSWPMTRAPKGGG